jgi:hypothetical protein
VERRRQRQMCIRDRPICMPSEGFQIILLGFYYMIFIKNSNLKFIKF